MPWRTFGLTIGEIDGEICLKLDKSKGKTYVDMLEMLSAWAEQAKKLEAGEITREDYDRWRYNYPKYDTTRKWVKVPSKWKRSRTGWERIDRQQKPLPMLPSVRAL